jgi:hypothetical protein
MTIPFGQFRFRIIGQIGEGGLGVVDEIRGISRIIQ